MSTAAPATAASPGATPVIEVIDVVAGYVPEVDILNGCNLEVRAGEFVGIIGPNGAGKSTLLKAVLGLVTIRSGTVRLSGDEITGRKAHELVERGVGFVPQTRNVFPSLTVTENLEMGCFLKPELFKERLAYVFELFPRLAERAGFRSGSLSGGERQMVAMGRALMLKPTVLLLDEPSAGLSPALQDQVFLQCRAAACRWRTEGTCSTRAVTRTTAPGAPCSRIPRSSSCTSGRWPGPAEPPGHGPRAEPTRAEPVVRARRRNPPRGRRRCCRRSRTPPRRAGRCRHRPWCAAASMSR